MKLGNRIKENTPISIVYTYFICKQNVITKNLRIFSWFKYVSYYVFNIKYLIQFRVSKWYKYVERHHNLRVLLKFNNYSEKSKKNEKKNTKIWLIFRIICFKITRYINMNKKKLSYYMFFTNERYEIEYIRDSKLIFIYICIGKKR